MKKINSNGYGGKIMGIAMVFVLAIPAIIRLLQLFYKNEILSICEKVSFGLGIIILLFLIVMLTIELHQDRQIILKYEAQKNTKLHLENGLCECQSCGNREVKPGDKDCSICGFRFKKTEI